MGRLCFDFWWELAGVESWLGASVSRNISLSSRAGAVALRQNRTAIGAPNCSPRILRPPARRKLFVDHSGQLRKHMTNRKHTKRRGRIRQISAGESTVTVTDDLAPKPDVTLRELELIDSYLGKELMVLLRTSAHDKVSH